MYLFIKYQRISWISIDCIIKNVTMAFFFGKISKKYQWDRYSLISNYSRLQKVKTRENVKIKIPNFLILSNRFDGREDVQPYQKYLPHIPLLIILKTIQLGRCQEPSLLSKADRKFVGIYKKSRTMSRAWGLRKFLTKESPCSLHRDCLDIRPKHGRSQLIRKCRIKLLIAEYTAVFVLPEFYLHRRTKKTKFFISEGASLKILCMYSLVEKIVGKLFLALFFVVVTSDEEIFHEVTIWTNNVDKIYSLRLIAYTLDDKWYYTEVHISTRGDRTSHIYP